ncbi:hypothetical protein Leryth_016489 [Lithospermum erythrorhizon]|nr:hypothetical protein Leryth_016489 [Lithospermum erythrorhizon]
MLYFITVCRTFISARHHSPKSRRKMILLLDGNTSLEEETGLVDEMEVQQKKDEFQKKDFPVDPSLPDMKDGIYQTDEFRMFAFKVKPCSRAYSHDWTECPFVHPGENARRRDPRKYHYSCVPCPDFRKGACHRGDACEYAHGIFECWLHPAQYRTRMCKDEEQCKRRVCFFAHKAEELRPVYASTGSGMPSPRSVSISAPYDIASIIPHGFQSAILSSTSTPPMTPSGASSSISGSMWPNQLSDVPPTLQLPGSRLKSAIHARDVDFDAPMSDFSSPTWRNNNFNSADFAVSTDQNGTHGRTAGIQPTNLDDHYGSLDPKIWSTLDEHSLNADQLNPPNGLHFLQNLNKQRQASYESSLPSSPRRLSSPFGLDPAANAAAVLTARSAAFAKRSWSFTDRTAANHLAGSSSPLSHTPSSALSGWGSPDGKLNWGIQGEELNKLRKSASFGARNNGKASMRRREASPPDTADEHEVSWVQSLVKDVPSSDPFLYTYRNNQQQLNNGNSEMYPSWVDQLYMEQEQIVAS